MDCVNREPANGSTQVNIGHTAQSISDIHRNCCGHAGFHCVAFRGCLNRRAGSGGENRSGGDCANGIPRNWCTDPNEVGSEVVLPTTTPVSIVAVGALCLWPKLVWRLQR